MTANVHCLVHKAHDLLPASTVTTSTGHRSRSGCVTGRPSALHCVECRLTADANPHAPHEPAVCVHMRAATLLQRGNQASVTCKELSGRKVLATLCQEILRCPQKDSFSNTHEGLNWLHFSRRCFFFFASLGRHTCHNTAPYHNAIRCSLRARKYEWRPRPLDAPCPVARPLPVFSAC